MWLTTYMCDYDCDKHNTEYNALISEQPYVDARWSIFTFPGQNKSRRPGHGTPWVTSRMVPDILGRLASLIHPPAMLHVTGNSCGISCTSRILLISAPGEPRWRISYWWKIIQFQPRTMTNCLKTKVTKLCRWGVQICWNLPLNYYYIVAKKKHIKQIGQQ